MARVRGAAQGEDYAAGSENYAYLTHLFTAATLALPDV